MQALILAGGKAQGLRPLTIHTPKPLIPIANRPFLFYQLELLKRANVTDLTLSVNFPPGKIEDHFGNAAHHGVNLRYAQEAQPLGTAGAFKQLISERAKQTVVLNGDILTNASIASLLIAHRELQAAVTILTYPVANPSQYGLVVADEDHRVTQFIEKPRPEQLKPEFGNQINAGIYVIEPRIAERIPAGTRYEFESQLFPALIAAGEPVYALPWDGYWLDLGTPRRYWQAHQDLLAGKVKKISLERPTLPSWSGEGEAPRIDKASLLDPSVALKNGVEIINSVIGANCVIEEKARLENCIVWSGTRIGAQAQLKNSFIGKSALIGKGVTLDTAVLGDKSNITDYSSG
ncbi:MAG: NDP-sugar synthase [Acidobacteria bacterium]|nr:NDP-sugar synthase [Acidobacteriota bacterium]